MSTAGTIVPAAPAQGSMAAAGGSSLPPKKPGQLPKGQGGKSQREKLIDFIEDEVNRRHRQNRTVLVKHVNKKWAINIALCGLAELRREFEVRHKPSQDHQLFADQTPGSAYKIIQDPPFGAGEESSFNLGGGGNYIPCVEASASRSAQSYYRYGSGACSECIRKSNTETGVYPFNDCITMEAAGWNCNRMFRRACLNCAWSNHYEKCSFVRYNGNNQALATPGDPDSAIDPMDPSAGVAAAARTAAQAHATTTGEALDDPVAGIKRLSMARAGSPPPSPLGLGFSPRPSGVRPSSYSEELRNTDIELLNAGGFEIHNRTEFNPSAAENNGSKRG